jgi:hypothetical protein
LSHGYEKPGRTVIGVLPKEFFQFLTSLGALPGFQLVPSPMEAASVILSFHENPISRGLFEGLLWIMWFSGAGALSGAFV